MTSVNDLLTPELLALAPALYFIGNFLKKYEHLEDRHIPVVLGIISIIINALYVFSVNYTADTHEIAGLVVTVFIQGILFAAAPVYIDQVIKKETTKG